MEVKKQLIEVVEESQSRINLSLDIRVGGPVSVCFFLLSEAKLTKLCDWWG